MQAVRKKSKLLTLEPMSNQIHRPKVSFEETGHVNKKFNLNFADLKNYEQ